jgi:hypothetical protein
MIPKVLKARQIITQSCLANPEGITRSEVLSTLPAIRRGDPIAVAVGSRGIKDLALIVRGIVTAVASRGGRPFIVPAMGSHGGATAEGQEAVLASYGITEEGVGAPVRSSMEVVQLPQGDCPCPVFMDRLANEAAGTIVVNRIKPHTDFHGPTESGLVKLITIGLGKHRQALEVHRAGVRGLREYIPACARRILVESNILLGVGIVENALHQTHMVRAIPAERIFAEEQRLLPTARELMGRLPAEELDILVVDVFGKDVSGTGMDTNVIGRMRIAGEPEPDSPRITAIVLTDLTDASHGNALGMGLADFITRRVYEKIDFSSTVENAVTGTFIERAKMPLVADTERAAIEQAMKLCRFREPENLRVLRIRSTLEIEYFYVSLPLWAEISGRTDVEQVTKDLFDLTDGSGELVPF